MATGRLPRIFAAVFFATSLALAGALAATWAYVDRMTMPPPPEKMAPKPAADAPVSPLLLHYRLNLPGRGEVFPALSTGSAADYWPVAVLSIDNTSSRPALQSVSAEIPGWSERHQQTVTVPPHAAIQVNLSPVLLPKAFENEEIRRVTLQVNVDTPEGTSAYRQTSPVHLHSASDIYWGKKFANAQYVARWVTPHDPAVLNLVSRARRYVPAGRLPGYISPGNGRHLEPQVRAQADAVLLAMKESGISYVSSIFTFGNFVGEAQRIRLPRETLSLSSANCIDVSIVFAAAMENLGLTPVIVIVPGHAFTGVRLGPQSNEILYLDLTVLPKGSLQSAAARAQYWLKKTPTEEVLTVDVAAARALGIYPM